MPFKQTVYSDFSGGYNDTSAAISIADSEFTISKNADYSAEVKALQTRKGCTRLNFYKYDGDVTDGYTWQVHTTFNMCVVKNRVLYEVDANSSTAELTEKIHLNGDNVYPFVMYNTLYFGDGKELYEWGAFDLSTDLLSKETVHVGDIVKCNLDAVDWSGTTLKGRFFQSLVEIEEADLSAENYTDSGRWVEVTGVKGYSSSVVRPMKAYDPSTKEIIYIAIDTGASAIGTVTLSLNKHSISFEVADNETINSIINKIDTAFHADETLSAEWDFERAGSGVLFTAKEAGMKELGYIDTGKSGIKTTYSTRQQGKFNDCNLTEIKKCTNFAVHYYSHRVFASGNPDDNAVFYSEIGLGNYWISDLNKVYPAVNGFGKVTGLCNISDYMLVSYENGWYAWSGMTPMEDASWKALNIPYGCIAPRSLVLTPNSFTFLAKEGIFSVSAAILNDAYLLMENQSLIRNLSDNKVEHTIKSMEDMRNSEAVFYENSYLIAFQSADAVPYDDPDRYSRNTVLKYDWSSTAFTLITGWRVNRWMMNVYDLYFASYNFILKAFEGFSDVDVYTGKLKGIKLHIKTKEYHFGTPFSNKNTQMIGMIFQQHDNKEDELSDIDIVVHAGYQRYSVSVNDLAESLMYKRMWGAAWGYREAIVKMIEIVMVANTFQIEIENDAIDDPVTLIGIGFVYNPTDYIVPTILKDEVLLT